VHSERLTTDGAGPKLRAYIRDALYNVTEGARRDFVVSRAHSPMSSQLTKGLCERLQYSQIDDQDIFQSRPTVQFLSIKPISVNPNGPAPPSANDRYRIILSDGDHFVQAMLATQLNHLVEKEAIGKNTIAVLERFTANVVQDRR
jgi:replication factor A1